MIKNKFLSTEWRLGYETVYDEEQLKKIDQITYKKITMEIEDWNGRGDTKLENKNRHT